MIRILVLPLLLFLLAACGRPEADMVFYNGKVYTVDSVFSVHTAFAVREGRIVATGTDDEILRLEASSSVDLKGSAVYPGFYDAHCHFYGYGVDLAKISLTGTASFDAVIDTLIKYRDRRYMGWVFGRGWDQNDWAVKDYPDRRLLDSLFPDVPVFLMRIDGHAALVNGKALELAGITASTTVQGGEVLLHSGVPTGLLIDNALELVRRMIPLPDRRSEILALMNAQENCFRVGLTSVVDAGLEPSVIDLIDSLQRAGMLKMRMNAMVSYSPANMARYRKSGPYSSDRLNVRSFKLYADGALGSRGACLLHPYLDLPGHHGFLLHSVDSLRTVVRQVYDLGFQLNTHCIGDSANRLLLNLYAGVLKGPNDLRWRIEHAQVLETSDFSLFSEYSVIPSVQPVHATSDMYWAEDRLGPDRMKGAYAYKRLLRERGLIAAGSDFPVEDINPLNGFYAAVVRKDHNGFPEGGFRPEDAISREEAMRAMTIWAAYASFEEESRGSIEKGKRADFVILEKDIMTAPDEELFRVSVMETWIGGERVFERR